MNNLSQPTVLLSALRSPRFQAPRSSLHSLLLLELSDCVVLAAQVHLKATDSWAFTQTRQLAWHSKHQLAVDSRPLLVADCPTSRIDKRSCAMSLMEADVQHLVVQALRNSIKLPHCCQLHNAANSGEINDTACGAHDSIQPRGHRLMPYISALNRNEAELPFAEACGTARTDPFEGDCTCRQFCNSNTFTSQSTDLFPCFSV